MGGFPVSDDVKAKIRASLTGTLETQAVIAARFVVSQSTVMKISRTLTRPPCGCGRPFSHDGHCRFRASVNASVKAALDNARTAHLRWTEEMDAMLCIDYPAGEDLGVMASKVSQMLGARVTALAVQSRVSRLDLHRPENYWAILAIRRKCGRPKGSKNKQPYPRERTWIARNEYGQFYAAGTSPVFQAPRRSALGQFLTRVAKVKLEPAAVRPEPVIVTVEPVVCKPPPKKGWSMSAMAGQDPRRADWLRDRAQGSKGKI